MFSRNILLLMAVGLIFCPAALGAPLNSGEPQFQQGQQLLQQGDFKGALASFHEAAKLNPDNPAYAEKAMLVSQVMRLVNFFDSQEDSPKWEQVGVSLHAFYHQNGVYKAALELGKKMHGKLNSTLSASLLAESLLAVDQNAETVAMLEQIKEDNAQISVYQGIALARLGRLDQAKAAQAKLPSCGQADPGLLFDMARLSGALGNGKEAARLLTLCMEKFPGNQTQVIKGLALHCADFKAHQATPAFATALKTVSKVAGCGGCAKAASGGCSSGGCSEDAKATDCSKDAGGCTEDAGACEKKEVEKAGCSTGG